MPTRKLLRSLYFNQERVCESALVGVRIRFRVSRSRLTSISALLNRRPPSRTASSMPSQPSTRNRAIGENSWFKQIATLLRFPRNFLRPVSFLLAFAFTFYPGVFQRDGAIKDQIFGRRFLGIEDEITLAFKFRQTKSHPSTSFAS